MINKKLKWGPTVLHERPRRHAEDERTMLQKAADLKSYKNLEIPHAKAPGNSFHGMNTDYLALLANKVDIKVGVDTQNIVDNINALKNDETVRCFNFDNDNPEYVLPVNLDIKLEAATDSNTTSDLLENDITQSRAENKKETWSQIVQKGLKPTNQNIISNDRCLLEH